MELIRRFPPPLLGRALEGWSWLPELTAMTPIVTSAFGDVFLHGPDGIWFLDLVDGTLTREWRDMPALQRELDTADGRDRFLLSDLVQHAARTGLSPSRSEVLAFTVPPALGGGINRHNIRVVDLVAGHHTSAHIHLQVNDVPPGTEIAGTAVG